MIGKKTEKIFLFFLKRKMDLVLKHFAIFFWLAKI